MKVLVTGATGRIGREFLFRRPDDAGVAVESLLEPLEQYVPDTPWFRTDITDGKKTLMAVTCSAPDVVVHLAAATDVDGCERDPEGAFRVNRDGTANIAEACAECGARMIYISTDYVFDGRTGPYSETDEPNPLNVYGRSKLEGENAVRKRLDRFTIVRISVPFGVRREGAGHNFVSWLMEELAAGTAVRIVDDQFTTPAFMDELAEILWTLVRKDVRGLVHYGTGDRLSRYDMALEVCRTMGFSEGLVEPVETRELGLIAARPLESGFVTDRLRDIIGRPPILFRNALYRMMEGGR